mmetsp:Transcript_17307/g.25369  ORF Transcript_17307/g.25369 Transcript_17307/m.25369 type:complete len:82 (-) Transcript_17307:330-575(-)
MMDDEETLQLSLAVAVQQESVFVRQQSLPYALLVPSPLRTSALDRFPVRHVHLFYWFTKEREPAEQCLLPAVVVLDENGDG